MHGDSRKHERVVRRPELEGNGSPDHIGRNAIFPPGMAEEWIHQNHIIRVRLDRVVLQPEFVSAFLNSSDGRAQMLEKAETTSGLYTLSTSKVASLEVPVPSLSAQAEFVGALNKRAPSTTRLHNALRDKLAALELLPSKLLASAFGGSLPTHGEESQKTHLAVVR